MREKNYNISFKNIFLYLNLLFYPRSSKSNNKRKIETNLKMVNWQSIENLIISQISSHTYARKYVHLGKNKIGERNFFKSQMHSLFLHSKARSRYSWNSYTAEPVFCYNYNGRTRRYPIKFNSPLSLSLFFVPVCIHLAKVHETRSATWKRWIGFARGCNLIRNYICRAQPDQARYSSRIWGKRRMKGRLKIRGAVGESKNGWER